MSRFTGPVKLQYSDNKKTAKLLEDLIWEVDFEGSMLNVLVPAGFETDGVTIPSWLWWFMPQWDEKGVRPAILHDYLRTRISQGNPHPFCPTWKRADRQFYLANLAVGHSKFKSAVLWTGVEAFTFFQTHTGRDPFTPEPK